MNTKDLVELICKNFLFWLSRKIDYPLISPDVVQVNFTFRCNLRCKMCSMHDQMKFLENQGKQTEIDSDVFRKVIKGAKEVGVKAVLFIGGEPFVREDLFDLVAYAKSLSLGTTIVTNGILLNEANIENCFKTGVDWMSISIDASSNRVFSKIRGDEAFLGKIIKNIRSLSDVKKARKKEFPKMVAVCTIMNDNLEELLDIVHLCKKLEIEKVLFQPVVPNNIDQADRNANSQGLIPHERLSVLDMAIDKLIDYKKESLKNFSSIGNNIKNLELIKRYFRGKVKPSESPCYAGYNRMQIVQEGRVYFCVNQQQHEANFGDVSKESLKDLWYSSKARSYRKLIRKCKAPCLQWCSYRDDFIELTDMFEKLFLFKGRR